MAYSDQDFENELREKIGNDVPLPPEMDWEAMRQGVKEKVAAKRKKKPLFVWWWLGIGLASVLFISVIGYQVHHFRAVSQPVPLMEESGPTGGPNQQVSDKGDGVVAATEAENSGRPAPSSVTSLKQQAANRPTLARPQRAENRPTQFSPQAAALKTSEELFDTGIRLQIPYKALLLVATNDHALPPTVTIPKAKALAMLPFRSHLFIAEGDFLPKPQVKVAAMKNEEKIEKDEPEIKGWFINVLAGTQFASSNYRGDDQEYAALRSETETALPGHHFAIGIGKSLNEKWQLRTGLAYDRIRVLTDYDGMRSFDSTFQNVPIRVTVSGDTIYGSATLGVRESREVRSFQREQRLALPLVLGRNFSMGKTQLTVRAGPELGLLIGSEGKVLTANEDVRSLSDTDFQRLSISARLEGELAVPLGLKGHLLIGRVSFRQVLGGAAAEVRRRGSSVVGGVGLRLPLK